MNSSRRKFLFRSFAAASLAISGRLYWVSSEEFVPDNLLENSDLWLFLEPEDRLVLAILTPVILDGVLPEPLSEHHLVAYLKDFDHSLHLLPINQQQEFKELLQLLKSSIGRVVLAGVWTTWDDVSSSTVDGMLNNWRSSYLDLIKLAYIGLKELSYATWYGNPDNWAGIGYSGPPEIAR